MNLRALTYAERNACLTSMSAHAAYALVVDALLSRKALSIVRVSDGERAALNYIRTHQPEAPLLCLDSGFRKRFGCDGISCGELYRRLVTASEECTYFSPTLGFFKEPYNLLPYFFRKGPFVDELYQYTWSAEMRRALMSAASRITVLNREYREEKTAAACPGAKFTHIYLSNWTDAERAKEEAIAAKSPLVLMSAGLASKYIGPRIAAATGSVVLDIGQAWEVWFP